MSYTQRLYTDRAKFGPGSIQTLVRSFMYFTQKNDPVFHRECLVAARKYEEQGIGGRKPASIAAAIVYGKSRALKKGFVQEKVSRYFNVTEVSVRSNIRYLERSGVL